MNPLRLLSTALAAAAAGASLTGVGLATQPQSPIDSSTWTHQSPVAFNTYFNGINYPYVWAAKVSWRGPEGSFARNPRVGERFYIRTELPRFYHSAWGSSDTFKTRVLLPAGVVPAVTAADDVICARTTAENVVIPPALGSDECQDPKQVGVEWQFPAVRLESDLAGQVSQVWFPVVASRAISGEKIQMLGDAVLNPLAVIPDPVVAEVALTVDPAPTNGTTGGTGGTASGGPATAPSSVKATSSAGGGTVVSWAPSTAPGVTGYRVQQRLVGTKKWETAGTTKASAKTFKLKKVKRGKKYQVRVATLVGGKVVAWSAPITVTGK